MNNNKINILFLISCAFSPLISYASKSEADSLTNINTSAHVLPYPFAIPEKAIVLAGDSTKANKEVIAVIYDTDNLAFNDPSVPRFQFFDREGNTVLGIGGQVQVFGYIDTDGMIDKYEFDVWNIDVGSNPVQRVSLGATPSQTAIFLKLAHMTKLGVFSMYVNANFAQGENKNSFGLRQAYLSWGGFTAGYARSTFSDPAATMPSIDPFGPIGTISRRNILLAYKRNFKKHFYGTISVEMPKATYTTNSTTQRISQQVPDIPINIQYTWFSGSHIRFAAILRNLAYKDLLTDKNKIVTGYGFQLSGLATLGKYVDFIYQASYGRGIGYYIKGTTGHGVDLIPSEREGKMIAPPTFAFVSGLEFNISKRLYMSTSYSYARLYEQQSLQGDMFRWGSYINANVFWSPLSGLQVGVGYIHGERCNMNKEKGVANRFLAMVKYSF